VQKAAWDQTNMKREESPNSQELLTGKVGEANLMTAAKWRWFSPRLIQR